MNDISRTDVWRQGHLDKLLFWSNGLNAVNPIRCSIRVVHQHERVATSIRNKVSGCRSGSSGHLISAVIDDIICAEVLLTEKDAAHE